MHATQACNDETCRVIRCGMHAAGSNRSMLCHTDAAWDADAGVVPARYGFPLSLPALHACFLAPHQYTSALIQSNLRSRFLGCTHSMLHMGELTSSRTTRRPAHEYCEARVRTADGNSHAIETFKVVHGSECAEALLFRGPCRGDTHGAYADIACRLVVNRMIRVAVVQ